LDSTEQRDSHPSRRMPCPAPLHPPKRAGGRSGRGPRGFPALACATRGSHVSPSSHMLGWPQFSLENLAGRLPRRTGPACPTSAPPSSQSP
jgi:hypothetical protein